jgi:aromatic ring-opening dioxygenase catalytic subunit (LigB family)
VEATASGAAVELDQSRGLDHGTWSVLARILPEAEIPLVQLSLDRTKPPQYRYELGLRDAGEPASFFTEKVIMCSLSMRSFMLD